MINLFKNKILQIPQISTLLFLARWFFISILIGSGVGSASAAFLASLTYVTIFRENHLEIVFALPFIGFLISKMYAYFSPSSEKGNNYVIEELQHQKSALPFWMAPLVFIGTVLTHLFGGSAGREGTAVQMGASISDQLSKVFSFTKRGRNYLLVSGVAAGFASVFGTPLAGIVFSIEMSVVGKTKYDAVIPAVLSAYAANYVTHLWQIPHTHYEILSHTELNFQTFSWIILASLFFGFAGMAFSKMVKFFSTLFSKFTVDLAVKSFIGGSIIVLLYLGLQSINFSQPSRYLGLGVNVIQEAFVQPVLPYDFALKLLFTTITLGAGFKGGEVTPLFFIGATLGNVLSFFIPLPFDLLAAVGFVAVFAAAANTPFACVFMGIELFGSDHIEFIAIGCLLAFFFSGHNSIYKAQLLATIKSPKYVRDIHKKMGDL